ncbi:MAG: hypothetical protein GC204_09725 [Chloroflexi bacterium]|nr:hypothetical protein [Chloroflexota bacterium]
MSKRLVTLVALLIMLASVFGGTQAQGLTVGPSDGTSNTVIFAEPQAPVNSLIMRDGGICDPIRHIGC